MRTAYTHEIAATAGRFGLDPDLLEAQVLVESSGEPWAWNPEPQYRYLWDVLRQRPFRVLSVHEVDAESPPADFHALGGDSDHEWWGQQASWGLLQIMGAVAREHGFAGLYLPQLCDVATNLELAATHLRGLLDWAEGDIIRALAAYNGGKSGNAAPPYRNQAYADRVLRRKLDLT